MFIKAKNASTMFGNFNYIYKKKDILAKVNDKMTVSFKVSENEI